MGICRRRAPGPLHAFAMASASRSRRAGNFFIIDRYRLKWFAGGRARVFLPIQMLPDGRSRAGQRLTQGGLPPRAACRAQGARQAGFASHHMKRFIPMYFQSFPFMRGSQSFVKKASRRVRENLMHRDMGLLRSDAAIFNRMKGVPFIPQTAINARHGGFSGAKSGNITSPMTFNANNPSVLSDFSKSPAGRFIGTYKQYSGLFSCFKVENRPEYCLYLGSIGAWRPVKRRASGRPRLVRP